MVSLELGLAGTHNVDRKSAADTPPCLLSISSFRLFLHLLFILLLLFFGALLLTLFLILLALVSHLCSSSTHFPLSSRHDYTAKSLIPSLLTLTQIPV